MKLSEFLGTLQETGLFESLEFELDDDNDVDIKVAYQPSWPMQVDIHNVHFVTDNDDDPDDPTLLPPTIYIETKDANSYLPSSAKEALDW